MTEAHAGGEERRARWPFVAVAVVLVTGLAAYLLLGNRRTFILPSESMEPTYPQGSRVHVELREYSTTELPERADVVMFADPYSTDRGACTDGGEERFIKRVIGLPGETLEIRNGAVWIDGARIEEPYLHPVRDPGDYGPYRVAENAVFVMGDNRINSQDSRFSLGGIPLGRLCGEVVGLA